MRKTFKKSMTCLALVFSISAACAAPKDPFEMIRKEDDAGALYVGDDRRNSVRVGFYDLSEPAEPVFAERPAGPFQFDVPGRFLEDIYSPGYSSPYYYFNMDFPF
ncbi:hypothetical protein [Delftia tsuruhatensis]|uniref:hypothetical protein n=1 Tax=Delftia tsuruhatensis TaxID=180282 RepID=UPI001F3D258B|nr:hypothetical protein [Delftia tsuruhatensis]